MSPPNSLIQNRADFGNHGDNNLAPGQYYDPSQVPLIGGGTVPVSSRMRGVVVRQSDRTGVPVGDRPNQIATKVFVDPDVPGGGFEVDMTKVSKQAMAEACQGAGMDMAMADSQLQEAAAMAMSNFANIPVHTMPVQPAAPHQQPPQQQQPQPTGVTTMTSPVMQPAAAQPQVQASPPQPQAPIQAAAFDNQATAHPAMPLHQQPQQIATEPQPVTPSASPQGSLFEQVKQAAAPALTSGTGGVSPPPSAPRIMVAMEYEGQGMKTEAYFHLVVRHHHLLVLAFDNRVQGYPKSFPRLSDKNLAVHITDPESGPMPVIFITQSAGIEFPLLNHDVCVLMIQDEKPVAQ
jgi:hypothetical protein